MSSLLVYSMVENSDVTSRVFPGSTIRLENPTRNMRLSVRCGLK
jgi:hypothetical protein